MIDIVRTSSVSYAESVRLALEAEGIPALVSNGNLGGLPPAAITVAVLDDADAERAMAVVRALDPPLPPAAMRVTGWRVLVLFLIAATLIVCGELLVR